MPAHVKLLSENDNDMKHQLENQFVLATSLMAFVSAACWAQSSTSKRPRREIRWMFGPWRRSGLHQRLRILVSLGWLALVACERRQTTAPAASEGSGVSRSLLPDEYGGTEHRTL